MYNPLPNGTGNGLSAFYYALLLLLAGFTGSIVVSTLVDSLLGYVPAEFGPSTASPSRSTSRDSAPCCSSGD
ncbi:conserved transmembrane domain protein [Mycobacterium ulcerans str. Harvey]|uniref:Conserved transmembrane domain protein n=1 Tax=Mycobacterium ulcerans str. Harvey TaxID=1299332 RepID=A0ABN0R3V6_MYCUL|nr:conserved transmembrane domain protein [Mycobacterium ulcerans str. Harvey]